MVERRGRVGVRDYKAFEVWRLAHQNALEVFRISEERPKTEAYGLTSQIKRSALSIPSNIAEGCAMTTNPHFAKYLTIARGSAFELEYQLIFLKDSNLITEEKLGACISRTVIIQKMLYTLINKISNG